MKSFFDNYLPLLPTAMFGLIAMQVLTSWIFIRFVHYEAQHRVLPRDTYNVEVITLDDYAKLQDHSLENVELSNGTVVTDIQPAFYRTVLPNYKKIEDHYVLVTTLGTSHFYFRWLTDYIPLALFALFGLFCSVLLSRRQTAKDI